jgi:hypothetical protein
MVTKIKGATMQLTGLEAVLMSLILPTIGLAIGAFWKGKKKVDDSDCSKNRENCVKGPLKDIKDMLIKQSDKIDGVHDRITTVVKDFADLKARFEERTK